MLTSSNFNVFLGGNCLPAAEASLANPRKRSESIIGKLTTITSTNPATLGKTYTLNGGVIDKKTAGHMLEGRFEVQEFTNADALAKLLADVRTDQALVASLPKSDATKGRIVTKAQKASSPGALSRSLDDFQFPAGQAGVIVLDYDPMDGRNAMTSEALWSLLQSIGVQDCGVIWWCSGSSFIYNGETEHSGLRGQRFYVMVADLADTERFGKVLAQRLWMAGYGRIAISSSGQRLVRDVFDAAMFQPARLDFIGGAVVELPLSQRRGAPVVLCDGGWLDTRIALPDLTTTEVSNVEGLQQDAKDAVNAEANAIREAYLVSKGGALTSRLVKSGVPFAEAHERAMQTVRSAVGCTLLGDFIIVLEGGREVSIAQVLDDRDKYHGAVCRDPLEPEYLGGKTTGKLYLLGASPNIHSFAHGGANYRLHRQPARIYLQAGRRAETTNQILARLAEELDLFLKGGVLVRLDAGRLIPITRAAALSYLVGVRYALFKRSDDGRDIPADLDDRTSQMLLATIGN